MNKLMRFAFLAALLAAAPAAMAQSSYMNPNQILDQADSRIYVVESNPGGGLDMVAVENLSSGATIATLHYNPEIGDWEAPVILASRPGAVSNPRLSYLPSGEMAVTWEENGRVVLFLDWKNSPDMLAFLSPEGVSAGLADPRMDVSQALGAGIQIPGLAIGKNDLVVFYRWSGTLTTGVTDRDKNYFMPVYDGNPTSGNVVRQYVAQLREDIPAFRLNPGPVAPSSSRAIQLREDIPVFKIKGSKEVGNWLTEKLRVLIVASWDTVLPATQESSTPPGKVIAVGIREDIPAW